MQEPTKESDLLTPIELIGIGVGIFLWLVGGAIILPDTFGTPGNVVYGLGTLALVAWTIGAAIKGELKARRESVSPASGVIGLGVPLEVRDQFRAYVGRRVVYQVRDCLLPAVIREVEFQPVFSVKLETLVEAAVSAELQESAKEPAHCTVRTAWEYLHMYGDAWCSLEPGNVWVLDLNEANCEAVLRALTTMAIREGRLP